MNSNRKLILYIACSLDGYIAKPGDDLSFLAKVAKENEDYGYASFLKQIDTVILGRKTYDWVMTQVPEFPHSDLETFVITSSPKASIGRTHFYTGKLETLIQELKQQKGLSIFCDGGAQLVNALLKEKLLDELIISIIPILLGDGIRLFNNGFPEQELELCSSKSYDTGLVQLHYQIHP